MSDLSNLLIGTAIGGILGVLFAPDKGINTRNKIKAEALDAKDKLYESAEEFSEKVASTVSNKKHSLEVQLENVVSDVSYKADDVISTLEQKLHELKEKNKNLQKKTATK